MKTSHWAAAAMGALALAGPAVAGASTRPDATLGNGLGRLIDSPQQTAFRGGGPRIDPNALTIRDAEGRVLVDLTAAEGADASKLRSDAEAAGMKVQAVDADRGTIEGFIALDKARALAALPGAGTLAQSLKPSFNTGSVTSQGVAFQRVDRLPSNINGAGITIAAQSDSYDGATTTIPGDPLTIHAADDVRTGDLPGPGNPVNSQPVVVLNDDDSGDGFDEGRAMLQLIHDIAPKSKLCFASADFGLVQFAQNVVDLANKRGPCGADVLVDDVVYYDEPFFSDSVMTDAIDKVSAQGAHYFTSEGNSGDAQGWESGVRLLNPKQYVKKSGLDFSFVDPALYDGGVQDMDPGPGTDIAQSFVVGPDNGIIDLQWDDPVDLDGTKVADPIISTTGELTGPDSEVKIPFTTTQAQVGKTFQVKADGIPSGSTDLILRLYDTDGTTILQEVDTGTSPEQLAFKVARAGTYTFSVLGFNGDTGDFTLTASEVLSPSRVSTDFNALLFDGDGNFLGALSDLNPLSGRPSEISGLGPGDYQLVISRAGTGPVGATRLRDILGGDSGFTEYVDPLAVSTFGHSTGRSTIGVGAFDPFKPYLPEYFTSVGGDLPILFDSAGNRYPKPQIRRTPSVSSTDGGNTTFFVSDTARDDDTLPNFFGTSAAAPHAAAIGALVLQSAGGGRSLNAEQLRQRLQSSTFLHDLDPMTATGSSRGVTITATGAQGSEADVFPTGINDPQFIHLSYDGDVPLKSIQFVGETGNPTGVAPGIVFDTRPFGGESPFYDDGFPFTVGATSGGLQPGDVTASFAKPAAAGQYKRMTLTVRKGLRRGQSLAFGIDRDEAVTAAGDAREGNGADSLGGQTFIPQRIPEPIGVAFAGTRTDGKQFLGAILNRIGSGWTPVEGYGVVDAQKAVTGNRRRR
ncbi:MAG: hypothetical protein QOF76_2620 [Solirubrobacteraceae bacterium]|nr:hypothetical protein [Solirubrobacteraceae bacterium]